jgi:hypothetical protein
MRIAGFCPGLYWYFCHADQIIIRLAENKFSNVFPETVLTNVFVEN